MLTGFLPSVIAIAIGASVVVLPAIVIGFCIKHNRPTNSRLDYDHKGKPLPPLELEEGDKVMGGAELWEFQKHARVAGNLPGASWAQQFCRCNQALWMGALTGEIR